MFNYVEYSDFVNWDFPVRVFHNTNVMGDILVNPHLHDFVEILYVMYGSGMQQIEENRFDISKGDIVVLNSNTIHGTISYNDNLADILVISFKPELLLSTQSVFLRNMLNEFLGEVDFNEPINQDSVYYNALKELLFHIRFLYGDQSINNKCEIVSDLIKFMGICVEKLPKKAKDKSIVLSTKREALYKALNYLDGNMQGDISLEEISKISGYSVSQFSRMIKSYTGMTFVDYLNNLRVNKICLDIHKGKSIVNSAYDNGFNTLSTFNRAFKKSKGVSPSRWLEIMTIHQG